MRLDRSSAICELIEQLVVALGSECNQSRGKRKPVAVFAIEEPIAWTHLFGYDANHYLSDPEFYFEQTLRQKLWRWNSFPEDQAKLTLDVPAWLGHYPEYTYVGMEVRFDSHGVPILQDDHALSKDPDLGLLEPVDFYSSGWMPRVLKWYKDLREIAAGRVNVTFNIQWWRGGLDLAVQLRGYHNFITDTIERPQFIHDLMQFLTDQRCRWHEAYWKHFGLERQKASIGDDWINVPFITPAMFEDFVLPYLLQIEEFHGGISWLHSCGNQTPIQKHLLKIKSLPGFEVSPWSDLDQSLINIPQEKWLGVGLHPNEVLCSTPEEIEATLLEVTDKCRGRKYSISTSGLTPITSDPHDYVDCIQTWIRIAETIMAAQPGIPADAH